jgi:hypothetical protein
LCQISRHPPNNTASDTAKPSLVGEALASYNQTTKIIVATAEVIPTENFSFKPTPEIRSYAELFTQLPRFRLVCAPS